MRYSPVVACIPVLAALALTEANAQALPAAFPRYQAHLPEAPVARQDIRNGRESTANRIVKGTAGGAVAGAVLGVLTSFFVACTYSEDPGCLQKTTLRFSLGGAALGLLLSLEPGRD